jgi:hypothetical protein
MHHERNNEHCCYTDDDVYTVATAFRLLQQTLPRSAAIGELTIDPDEAAIEAVIRRDQAYAGHHVVTARMRSLSVLQPSTSHVDNRGACDPANPQHRGGRKPERKARCRMEQPAEPVLAIRVAEPVNGLGA